MTYIKTYQRNSETNALNDTIRDDLNEIVIKDVRIMPRIYLCEEENSRSLTFIFETNQGIGIFQLGLFDEVIAQFNIVDQKAIDWNQVFNIPNLRQAMSEENDQLVGILSRELAQKGECNNLFYLGCLRKLFKDNEQMVQMFYHFCKINNQDPMTVWNQIFLQAKGRCL
jgi:hypothetical protein